MYNIYTQACGLIITIIILIFFLTQKKIPSKNKKNFKLILYTSILLFCIDIASTIMIYEIPNELITIVISKIYLMVLLATLFLTLIYVSGATFPIKAYRRIEIISYSALVISIVILSILKLNLVSTKDYIYSEGPAALYCYAVAIVTIVVICILSIVFRVQMNRDRSRLILLWMGIWVALALVQFFFKQILVVSFAVGIGLAIIFIKFEDLEGEIDKNSGLFNFYSYVNYLNNLKRLEIKTPMVYLKPLDIMYKLDEKIIEEGKRELNIVLSKIKGVIAFINEDRYLLILTDMRLEELNTILSKARNDIYFIGKYYEAYYFSDVTKLKTQNDIRSIISYSKDRINYDTLMHEITNEIITDYYSIGDVELLINDCISNDRVVVYFQPIFSTKKKKIVSAEALCRLIDSNGKIVPPNIFIPVAEKVGSINKIDEIVFDKVCKFISNNDMAALGLDYIETNLSVVQLSDENLAKRYLEIINNNHVDHKYINLEITESAEALKTNSLHNNLAYFINNGVSLSLDDYGTGYSNLSYVATMPVKIIKFDKVMTDEYFSGSKAKFVMDYSIRMFKAMDLKVVSEGVETKNQLDALAMLGVDFIQGFYFSKPIPMEEFILFIKNFKYEENMD